MKVKKVVVLFCCLIVGSLGLLVTGCGTDMSDSAYCGTWKADKASYSEIETDAAAAVGGTFKVSFNEDGTCDLVVGEDTQTGTWVETEKGVCINEDKDMTFTDEDGSLVLKYDDMTIFFEKK